MTDPRVIAEVRSADGWDGLLAAFRQAIDDLRMTYETAAEIACLPDRYIAQLLAQHPSRRVGRRSFGPLMQVAAVRLLVVRDDAAYARILRHPKYRPRKYRKAKPNPAGGNVRATRKRYARTFRGDSAWGKLMRSRQLVLTAPQVLRRQMSGVARASWTPKARAMRALLRAQRKTVPPIVPP